MTARLAIGIGCRRGCPADTIAALVRDALARIPGMPGLSPSPRRGEGGRRPDEGSRRQDAEGCASPHPRVADPLPGGEKGLLAAARGGSPAVLMRLFTIAEKAGEAGLVAAAADLGLDMVVLPREVLETVMDRVLTRSAAAVAAFGLASVSEAAALAGAGPRGRLVVPRIAAGGATCAVALSEEGA